MTDEERLLEVIEHLTEGHLDNHGGYPYDYEWFGATLVVAELDDFKERRRTLLATYKKKEMLAWHKRATKLMKEYSDEYGDDFRGAMWETASADAPS